MQKSSEACIKARSPSASLPLCSSRKYACPRHGKAMEIPREWGVSKTTILKESIELNWNFQRVGEIQTKQTFHGRCMDIFLESHLKWHTTLKCPISKTCLCPLKQAHSVRQVLKCINRTKNTSSTQNQSFE